MTACSWRGSEEVKVQRGQERAVAVVEGGGPAEEERTVLLLLLYRIRSTRIFIIITLILLTGYMLTQIIRFPALTIILLSILALKAIIS
jgi:hypothetical protein